MGESRPTIVVIDDSSEVRAVIKTRLRVSGQLDVVADGENGMEAIGLAYSHQPDLLLLDMSMPSLDGLDALPGILEVAPNTKVVVYSGFEERQLARAARDLGASAYIAKSLPIESLADELIALVRSGDAAGQQHRRERHMAVVPDPGGEGAETEPVDQRLLTEHLESFREVFEEAAIGMATLTLSGGIVRANRSLAAIIGCEPADLVGVDYGRIAAGSGDLLDAALAEISSGAAEVVKIEHDIAGDPEPRRALATLAAVRDSTGKALYAFLQLQDVTAQAEAEARLRRSEERFRLFVDAVQEYAIFRLDRDGRVASWNAGAERIKGYTADEIVGKHFSVFYPPEKQASGHPQFELDEALRVGRYEEEGWRIRKDGTRFWANVLITAVFDESGEHVGYAKVTRDTTERREAEQQRMQDSTALAIANQELESLNSRLQQAVDDQSRFLAVTAHELRSPLAVLGGAADTLVRHWDDLADDERRLMLDGMKSSSARMQRLVKDLLTAARLEAGSLTFETHPAPVSVVVDQVVDALRAGDPGSEIDVRIDADLEILTDPDRLAQALENLVRNAFRHGVPPVRIQVESDAGAARISVIDAGEGVDPDIQPRLFERFATGDRLEGSGLGLFIARELAHAQGGDAYYEAASESRPGGAFVITAPLASSSLG